MDDMNAAPDPQNILVTIASVPKGASKETLVATIDEAINGIVANLRTVANGAMPPELLKATQVALNFLEACSKLGDAPFRDHIKVRAGELHRELAAAANGKARQPPAAAEKPAYSAFEPAFADYFCEFLRLRLEAFQFESDPLPFPYVLNKEFAATFERAVHAYIVPEMLKARRVRNMADSVSLSELTRSFFFEEFNKQPNENPFHLLWNGLMEDFRAALAPPTNAGPTKGKGAKGGLGGLLGKGKAPTAPPKKTVSGDRHALAEKFFKLLQAGAAEKGFDPPHVEDFNFFRALMDYKLSVIAENKRALSQLLQQENLEDEDFKAREGATRDWLYRIVDRLPPHCGELLALWAYRTHGELFTEQMLRSFMAGQGTTEEKRQRSVPMFSRWMREEIG